MSVGQEFWIVATGCTKSTERNAQAEKDSYLALLKSQPALQPKGSPTELAPVTFAVPDGERSLIFGSFDTLIRLTDDLQKSDQQIDAILHRLERQYLEIDPRAEFKVKSLVKSQRQEKPFIDYLRSWQWDEAKYHKSRSITDNLALIMSTANKLDEEARNKTAQYNDFKLQKSNIAMKPASTLTNRDLIDVLTPDVVRTNDDEDDDFIDTKHLTTLPVILNRSTEEEFLKVYASLVENVVPLSARKFKGLDDKDGNSIWRVIMFKSAAEGFKKACRERRFIVRDFEYSEESYKKIKEQRAQIDGQVRRQHELIKGLYQAAWSEAMVAWMHIKAMRVFVESVLRFGMPPRFAAFIVAPKASAAVPARKALAEALGNQGGAGAYENRAVDTHDEGEEYYPYVSLSFTPFIVPRSS